MFKRRSALVVSSLAMVAGSVLAFSTPATASANISPTAGVVPGTTYDDLTISAAPGDFLCESSTGVESANGATVTFGVIFVSSADEVWDYTNNDDTVLASSGSDDLPYVAGATTSPAFDVEVPVLAAHDPNNNILVVEFCDPFETSHIQIHDTTVISYSDATMESSTVTAGGTGTISLIDGTDDTLACDGPFTSGPYTMGLKVYSSFDAFDNSADPVVVIPEGWDNDGPGFGSFTKSELADGVDESFTVPESLAAGDYYGAVFCINEDGFWGDSPPMGLVPFSVEEENLAPTGGNTTGVAGIAVLGYSLFALGALGWVLLRRRAKA
jgi:hypothetical protein